jgi:hypothetical protein
MGRARILQGSIRNRSSGHILSDYGHCFRTEQTLQEHLFLAERLLAGCRETPKEQLRILIDY